MAHETERAVAAENGTKAWAVTYRKAGSKGQTHTAIRFGQTAEAASKGVEWDIRGRAFPAEIISVVAA